VLGEREDLRAKERDNVIGDELVRCSLEVGIVDAQRRVEPVDLPWDEVRGDKSL
jgi:hypothetical protein